MSHIVSVSRSDRHSFSKVPQGNIRLISGEGVEGDAHRGATTQHVYRMNIEPEQPNLAEVHLFASEKLEELRELGFIVQAGEIGENILTRGLNLHDLPLGTRLHLGLEAVVEVTGERQPCSQIDRYQRGLQQKLWGPRNATGQRLRRAGIMAVVLVGGVVHPNDSIRVELPCKPHRPLGPV